MLVFFISCFLFIILIYLSGISIKINHLEIEKKELKDMKITVYLLLFNKIKILKLSINKKQIEKIIFHKIINRFKGRSIKQDKNIIIRILKELKIQVNALKVNAKIGLNNALFLAYLVTIFNIIFSIFYAKIAKKNKENYKYEILPYQTDKFHLKISINCIINIKIANIINMIIMNRSENKDERTSNRGFNGNCHEQHTRYGRCKHYYRSTN